MTNEPVKKPVDEEAHEKNVLLEEVQTDVYLGKGTLKDLMMNQIQEDKHEIKNIEELEPQEIQDSTDSSENQVSDEDQTINEDQSNNEDKANATDEEPKQQIDGDKLRALMEEEGPLEEHTREIKEKPKDVKPKEEYAENSVDLNQMFNVHK